MPSLRERRRRVDTHPIHHNLPLAEEDQSDVREGREITAASQRPVLGDPRRDARREQCEQAVDEQRSDAAVGHRQRSRPQQHHGPHDFVLDGFAEAGCVRPDQRRLEARPGRRARCTHRRGSRSRSRRHRPACRSRLGVRRSRASAPSQTRASSPSTSDATAASNRDNVINRQTAAAQDDGTHQDSSPSRFIASVYSFASICWYWAMRAASSRTSAVSACSAA